MTYFEIIFGGVQSLAITAAAVAAFLALNTWRKQLLGQRKVELAEQVLAKLYMARDAIKWARFPVNYFGEGASRPTTDDQDETPDEKEWLNGLFVPVERLNKHSELFSDIAMLRHRVVPYFGESVGDALFEIEKIRRKIEYACWANIRTFRSEKPDQPKEKKSQKRKLKYEAITSDILDNSQEREKGGILESEPIINEQLDDLVAKVEEICLPILKGK